MTSAWCSYVEAAEHLGITREKLNEAVADSERFGIKVPMTNHGTEKKRLIRFCVARLDAWMLEVGEWRRSESSRVENGRFDGVIPMGTLAPSRRRRRRHATSSTPTSPSAKKPEGSTNPMRAKLRALESTTP